MSDFETDGKRDTMPPCGADDARDETIEQAIGDAMRRFNEPSTKIVDRGGRRFQVETRPATHRHVYDNTTFITETELPPSTSFTCPHCGSHDLVVHRDKQSNPSYQRERILGPGRGGTEVSTFVITGFECGGCSLRFGDFYKFTNRGQQAAQASGATPTEGDLRVWHIPQIPGKPFHVVVDSLAEAKLVLDTLAYYDLFQLKHHIKPDFSNAQGLQVFEDGEWVDWYSEDGEDIDGLSPLVNILADTEAPQTADGGKALADTKREEK